MRLEPVRAPRGVIVRLLFLGSRWMFGRVLAPVAVVYGRMPGLVRHQLGLLRYLSGGGLSVPRGLRILIESYVSRVNGCAFCGDLHEWDGRRHGIAPEAFADLADPERSARFDEKEKAALLYAAAVAGRRVDDAVFARLARSWDERAIVEITVTAAFTSYLNLMAVALQLPSEGLCAVPAAVTAAGRSERSAALGYAGGAPGRDEDRAGTA